MTYTLLVNFRPSHKYEGVSGEDSHGKYILFPPESHGVICAGDFLQDTSGKMIQIYEETSVVIDGIRYPKLYYK